MRLVNKERVKRGSGGTRKPQDGHKAGKAGTLAKGAALELSQSGL